MDLELRGRTALVTGASAGIGRAIAMELGKEGVRLVITGRRKPELEKLSDEIVSAGGARPGIVVHDAMDEGYVDAIANECEKTLGEVQILVNNAGGSRAFGKDGSDQQWNEAFTLNFTRHRQLTLRFLPPCSRGIGVA
jgi:3-oxoacyl-[acyl-carrier protein] reductase